MSDYKQVKVDNWGIYFLQRLKHFFNRTDYCDLTLQFQDNAQLKVHRLVLSACTEYFELLERTCEMYEDCLVMPDDLQADVVVPIVNFMYTGQLEFKMDMLERLYQTSLVMNMPVLSKLLDAHRLRAKTAHSYSNNSLRRNNRVDSVKQTRHTPSPSNRMTPNTNKRSYSNAFQTPSSSKQKVVKTLPPVVNQPTVSKSPPRPPSPMEVIQNNKKMLTEPRPTRYELPEELDTDNIFENSFSNISYTSTPLMVHPETTKHYPSKKDSQLHRKLMKSSTMEIVECKKVNSVSNNVFEDIAENTMHEPDLFQSSMLNESHKDPNQLFDQILDPSESSKVVIETKGGKQASNIDHAKIISEVLKKYPHLVKSNKNIKLKILNTPSPSKVKREKLSNFIEEKEVKPEPLDRDYTYETDVLDSKEAAKLIAMGAENIKGPWICLICGTPGRALHFTSYYKFRRHLVEVHNEKCIPTICEYCGFKSFKRNYMVHHVYTKHGVKPPQQYNFPKCNQCNFIAITEGSLVKHKLSQHASESKNFRCNVCMQGFPTYSQLLAHVQKTGHRITDKKANFQCIYCLKVFLRESNLYAHLKTYHKRAAKRDGIVDDSDEEKDKLNVKREAVSYDDDSEDGDVHYQIHQRADGVHVVSKNSPPSASTPNKQKILNAGFGKTTPKQPQKIKPGQAAPTLHNEFMQDEVIPSQTVALNNENIIVIDNVEYVMRDNELIPKKNRKEFVNMSELVDQEAKQPIDSMRPSTSMQFDNIQGTDNVQQAKMIIKKSNMNQPIQIVVSSEEEYKALMASNHSIIFDDGDSNKTLTMMTAPETLDTTGIDLENTQSNNMMIIQDDYPLNVTEAVGTDNNIVVVYSHPVGQINDDTDKQYQIITSQDIGAQFIQSSAMITQNYETVTTSTPVMSANVIEAQLHESWQNNEQHIETQQIHITSDVNLQDITQIQVKTNDTDANEVVLPAVELTSIPKETPAEFTTNKNSLPRTTTTIMSVEEVTQNDSEQITDNVETDEGVSITPMDAEVPCADIQRNETEINEAVITTNDMDVTPVSENNLVHEQSDQQIHTSNMEQHEELIQDHKIMENQEITDKIEDNNGPPIEQAQAETEDISEEAQTETEDISEEAQTETEDISEEAKTELEHVSKEINDVTQTCVVNVPNIEPAIKVTKEQIQNLTSEWSEDEYEVNEDSAVLKDSAKSVPDEEPREIEESIENIQQELDKQIVSAVSIEESMDSTLNKSIDSTSSELNKSLPKIVPQETQPVPEKLSSLLNDWEDNESQGENETQEVDQEIAKRANDTNESEPENADIVTTQEENGDDIEDETDIISIPRNIPAEQLQKLEKADIAKVDPKKDEKLKSLVSDWDDDDDEEKE
ncbi:centrosome-associated zinc finger protein Cp190 [Plodia interpunctella]|uniref:centrosome-associated zinc finger protein Cp190 n=1 Tax=Plodia interpunctella TaxID=58824 RepID=UPI0023676EBC|nr:centrosome-associated zinc finger protein CP190 [Plodia interpunctella]